MQGKTENIIHCFKMNKKIFPLFTTENIQLSSTKKYSATAFLMKMFSSKGYKLENREFCGMGCMTSTPLEWKL